MGGVGGVGGVGWGCGSTRSKMTNVELAVVTVLLCTDYTQTQIELTVIGQLDDQCIIVFLGFVKVALDFFPFVLSKEL